MDVAIIAATFTNTLVLGSMYVLVALGFAFLFNMLGIFNLAHGAIYMIGGFIGYQLISGVGINQWVALVLSIAILAAFGVFLERFCFRPFQGNFNRTLMICVSITTVLQTSANIISGVKSQAIPHFVEGIFQAGTVSISYQRILIFTVGIVLLGVIIWLVRFTKLGRRMMAIAQNMEGATLQGVNIHRVSAIACAIGCALAALAGCFMAAHLFVAPFMGLNMLVKVIIVVMMAGIGSFGGILIAGFALGALDAVLPVVFAYGAASEAITMVVVVIIILLRPKGLFGHEA
jgi:branched-chain amino acid transport system permease protein